MNTKLIRKQTATGEVVRFSNGPLHVPDIEWPHEGTIPDMTFCARDSHVSRLLSALNAWWDRCHGRAPT